MFPYIYDMGQLIKTSVPGVAAYWGAIAIHKILGANAPASDADGILASSELTTARSITTGLSSPAAPRNMTITGNVSGITGNVKVYGTNYLDAAIDETIALNGTSTVAGAKAFKSVTKVDLPAKVHTKAKQTETMEVTHAVTSAGDVALALTAAALGDASPKSVVVAIASGDDSVTKVAAAMVLALNADEDVGAAFVASNVDGVITLTAKVEAANDTSLALAFTDTDTTGVTMGSSTNGTAGVAPDLVTVGFGEILGLPYLSKAKHVIAVRLDQVTETTAATEVADADEIEKNTVDLNSSLNGKDVDVYMIVP